MKHLGDICKISGRDAPTVNVIIGGSPCQDLSVAGKRAGLSGERSGLFMEQIRIIKEMRAKDAESGRTGTDIRPRFMVWENVPGAFSVNGGRDFAAVLEETAKVADKEIPDIPVPKNGWSNSGCIMGRGFSIAWRVLDAQFFGVPQRRRRIALVADFAGRAAPEILFERESVSGHSEPCEAQTKGPAGNAADCTGTASGVQCLNPYDSQSERVYDAKGVWHSLNANSNGGQSRDAVFCLQGNGIDRSDTAVCNGKGWTDGSCYTLNTIDRPAVCYHCYQSHHMDARYTDMGDIAETVCARYGTGGNNMPIVCMGYMSFGEYVETETVKTLLARDDIATSDLCCVTFNGQTCGTLDAHYSQCPGARGGVERDVVAVDCRNGTESETNGTLQAKENGGTSLNLNNVCRDRYIVRRLTPLECTRLQGYPDGWVDIGEWTDSKGKRHKDSDSAKYKAIGNSIAIPPWLWVLSRLNEYCDEKTMASLFDGIGGFPLIWEFLNGKGSAVWCSEIEEFPIAVTKRRFPDE